MESILRRRFGEDIGETIHLILMEESRAHIVGSTALQMASGDSFDDSDLDILTEASEVTFSLACHLTSKTPYAIKDIIAYDPINNVPDHRDFAYNRLRTNHVNIVMMEASSDEDLPPIQILTARNDFRTCIELFDFDCLQCHVTRGVLTILNEDAKDAISERELRMPSKGGWPPGEYVRSFERIVKYQKRGFTHSKNRVLLNNFIRSMGNATSPRTRRQLLDRTRATGLFKVTAHEGYTTVEDRIVFDLTPYVSYVDEIEDTSIIKKKHLRLFFKNDPSKFIDFNEHEDDFEFVDADTQVSHKLLDIPYGKGNTIMIPEHFINIINKEFRSRHARVVLDPTTTDENIYNVIIEMETPSPIAVPVSRMMYVPGATTTTEDPISILQEKGYGIAITPPDSVHPSVDAAQRLYRQNTEAFVVASKHTPASCHDCCLLQNHPFGDEYSCKGFPLYHVPFDTFKRNLAMSVREFLTSPTTHPCELWMMCFEESGGQCFTKSNIWVSLLALQDLRPILTRVRIMTPTRPIPSPWVSKTPVEIIIVDDGIYSGRQFWDRIMPMFADLLIEGANINLHVIVPYVTYRFLRSLNEEMSRKLTTDEGQRWFKTSVRFYASCVMNQTETKSLTSFYFDHKIPDSVSSVIQLEYTCMESIEPPYRKHEWTWNDEAINNDYIMRNKEVVDKMDLFT